MGRALRAWGWWREQEYPLESTLRERFADLRQRRKARRAEREPWNRARTLSDLGELTAQWAEGIVKFHPGGYDEGPAEETIEIAPALVILNRNGFVTSSSQPGIGPVEGYDGRIWWQRAAVDGFADPETADLLEEAVRTNTKSLIFIRTGRPKLRTNWNNRIPVTATPIEGELEDPESSYYVHTQFGIHLSRRAVEFEFDGFGTKALFAAEQITVVDPVWGRRNHLWDTLTTAIAPPCCPCNERH